MKHGFVRWKSTEQATEGDYGVQNLTGKVTLGFTLGEGELRRKGIKISLSFIKANLLQRWIDLYIRRQPLTENNEKERKAVI